MDTDLLFKPINQATVDASRYEELEHIIRTCDVISRLTNQSIYLVDYVQQKFLYVSPHPLFLCGYSAEEVKETGIPFFQKVLSADEFQMLAEIMQMGWKIFYSTPEERMYSRISYDLHLCHKNGAKILVNQKVSPLLLGDDGNVWLSIVIVNHSPHKASGNVVFTQKDKDLNYTYDFEKKKIISYIPDKLTKREEEILLLSMQGYSETIIGEKLNLSAKTIKNHRSNAIRKLGTNNLTNAISRFNLKF